MVEGAIVWFATKATISLAVWSAVAPDSMPSSFDPSVARSRPSTVPPTVIFETTFKVELNAAEPRNSWTVPEVLIL